MTLSALFGFHLNDRQGKFMDMGLVWLVAALTTGLTSSYTTRTVVRSSGGLQLLDTQGLFRAVVGTLGFFAVLAVIVWGFVSLPWWWVVLAFVGVSLFVVPLVFGGRGRLPLMHAAQPVFDMATIAFATYLWLWF